MNIKTGYVIEYSCKKVFLKSLEIEKKRFVLRQL